MSDKKPPAKKSNVWSRIASGRKNKSSQQSLDDSREQDSGPRKEDRMAAAELVLDLDDNDAKQTTMNSDEIISVSSSGQSQQGGNERTRGERSSLYYDEEAAAASTVQHNTTDEGANSERPAPPLFRPRPPQREQVRPGAFAVTGPDGNDQVDDYTINPTSTQSIQDATVAAQPVNVNEIIEQRVNRVLQEARQRATVAEAIVTTTNNNDNDDNVVDPASEREVESSGWLVSLRGSFQRIKRSLRREERESTPSTEEMVTTKNNDTADVPSGAEVMVESSGWLDSLRESFQRVKGSLRQEDQERETVSENVPTNTATSNANNKAVVSSESEAVGFCDPNGRFITLCVSWFGPRARLLGIASGILALAAILVAIFSLLSRDE